MKDLISLARIFTEPELQGKHDLWNIVSALRGWDVWKANITHKLKHFTTARIRSFVTANQKCLGVVEKRALNEDEINLRRKLLQETISNAETGHFIRHFHDAAIAIEKLTGYNIIIERITDKKKWEAYRDAVRPFGITFPRYKQKEKKS